jgi:uncharacterized membrane protein SirB2
MEYLALKQIHVACAVLSYAGFFVRGVWMIRDSPMLGRRWVRIVPHINDTVLLAAAIALAVMLRQYPFAHGWVTAKVLALAAYIVLGMMALKPGRPKAARAACWIAAQAVFLYIAAVALTRNPLVFASLM